MARGWQTRRFPDWMIGLAITMLVLGMAWVRPAFLESMDYRTLDLSLKWFGSRTPAQNIAIVTIDDESVTKLGCWPWPSMRLAALVDLLPAKGAKIIGLGVILSEPEEQSSLQALETIKQSFRALGNVKGGAEFL